MRTLMIPVADRPECATALRCAFEVAQRLDMDVLGYHLRPHHFEGRPPTAAEDKAISLRRKAAETVFSAACERHGVPLRRGPGGTQASAMWRELKGTPEHVFPIVGPMSDLIVVSRPRNRKSATARAFQMGALMRTGTPVMMLPSRGVSAPGKRVLLCWNQSLEAAATVKAVAPLLAAAEAVTVFVAGKEDGAGPKSTHLQQYLRHWGVKATRIATRGRDLNGELKGAYDDSQSDLLVMGAYSRSRWREQVFGGLTEHVLHHTSIPALMLHR